MVQHHANRIGLVEKNGTFSSILTQHRIIKWLAGMDQTEMGVRLASSTIGQLGLGFRTVVTVQRDQPVFAAFLAMYSQRVSGVAVTDGSGILLGNISISDLKDIGHVGQNYEKLFMTSGNFLTTKSEGAGVPTLVYCTKDSSLKEILGKFKSFFIHRVYIVKKSTHQLVGVVTPSDILQLFAKTPITHPMHAHIAGQGKQTTGEVTSAQQALQQSPLPSSDVEFASALAQLESAGGLWPLMISLSNLPEFASFNAPEYGAGPSQTFQVWQQPPFFAAFTPQAPFALPTQQTPERIDVFEQVKVIHRLPSPAEKQAQKAQSQAQRGQQQQPEAQQKQQQESQQQQAQQQAQQNA